jgi:hypothetical protein
MQTFVIIAAMPPKARWLLLPISLLSFALRIYQLDTQSIWYDEGLSIQIAIQDPPQAIALSATTDHPPLHAAARRMDTHGGRE